ncbi:hypothetical protein JHK86_017672 [Glycine max]|nr:hypothetical protein JHK86_017672 [Glycine max]
MVVHGTTFLEGIDQNNSKAPSISPNLASPAIIAFHRGTPLTGISSNSLRASSKAPTLAYISSKAVAAKRSGSKPDLMKWVCSIWPREEEEREVHAEKRKLKVCWFGRKP